MRRKTKHGQRILSVILTCIIILSMFSTAFADGTDAERNNLSVINKDTMWKYLDDNSDPAGSPDAEGYSRTSWTAVDFDDSAWKTASGTFGSKRGSAVFNDIHTADNVLLGNDGRNNAPTYYFRTNFNLDSLQDFKKLVGDVLYDDGVIVYINGQRIATGHDFACDDNGNRLGHGFNANNQYGGSNNNGPEHLSIELNDLSVLKEGKNTVAVEIHNGRKTSSDIWFSMKELKLVSEEPPTPPVVAPTEFVPETLTLAPGNDTTELYITWYANEGTTNAQVNIDNRIVDAVITPASTGKVTCRAVITGLVPGQSYNYRVSNDGGATWSKEYGYNVPSEGDFRKCRPW